jgi:hypothetical protein
MSILSRFADKSRTLLSLERPRDIVMPRIQVQYLNWQTDDDIQTSVRQLFHFAEASANYSIDWYEVKRARKAAKSRALRFTAILLTVFGGLTPVFAGLGVSTVHWWGLNINLGQIGYLFLGLAAACIGLDRFFGFSSGWMRYISTKMTLEKSLSEFRLDWAMLVAKLGANPPTADQVQLMIQRVREFLLAVTTQVEQETQAWVSEFKTNLAEVEKTAKAQGESTSPGAIDITVTNGLDTEDGFTVEIDGMQVKRIRGTNHQIGYVPPGPHKIAVSGKINGEQRDASELVNVAPGEIAKATLALPVK